MSNVDVRMTFDTFVVGPGNRLASAAARRAADSPAASYNPLFLYSASGLGKSHILSAMAHHSERLNPDSHVLYQTLEGYLDELADAIQKGIQEELKDRYRDLDILLLDDVQFLTGQPEAQEMLLRTLDSLNLSGSQIVLASDRPPAEIDGLDARLLSRFSGGLMVDIAPPELETRVAIIRKKCESRNAELATGVSEQIARLPFRNVRELMGGLNRVLAAQELEGRAITPEDVAKLVDIPVERPRRVRRADRLSPLLSQDLYEAPEEAWQKLIRVAAEEAEAEGFATGRLRRVLDGEMEPSDPQKIVDDFQAVLTELRTVRSDLDVVGNPWPEAARGVLLDPDRVEEARALLASARERVRAFPLFPLDLTLEHLKDRYPQLAVRAAGQLISEEPPEYNPLFVWSPDGHGARGLLEATGAACLAERPETRVAFISAKEFADEFIDALSDGVAGAWRERWWTVELLLIHGCQELSDTERAQDEFFHLFEAVKRRGARVVLAADRNPSSIENIDDRLRSRFEGGLVVHTDVQGVPPTPVAELLAKQASAEADTLATDLSELDEGGEVGPDLQVRRAQGDVATTPESSDPDFDQSLAALDGGSEAAAWAVKPPGFSGPRALTQLKMHPDDFPTLLSEKEKERARAGLEETPTGEAGSVEGVVSSVTAGPSGEAMAPESAVGSNPSEAAGTPRAQHEGSSSEAPGPAQTAVPAQAVDEHAPIVTAADLPLPRKAEGEAAIDDGAPDNQVSAAGDATSAQPEPPVSEAKVSKVSVVANEKRPQETAPGPWVAEALPAVLEHDLDDAIDALFGAHQSESPLAEVTAPEPPTSTPTPAPTAEQAAPVEAAPVEAAPVEAAPVEAAPFEPAAQVDASHLDDEVERRESGGDGPSRSSSDYGFGAGADAGVATRTRTRRTAQVDAAPAPSQTRPDEVALEHAKVETPMIEAVPESDKAAVARAPVVAWMPTREETVWDWPSLEARIVVDD